MQVPPHRLDAVRVPPLDGLARAWLALATFVFAWLCLAAGDPRAETTEYEVKAAFLVKFTSYVKWPEKAFDTPKAPFVVAVVGPDPFGKALDDAFKDKTVGLRKVQVVRFKTAADVGACHVLFVSAQETPKLAKILELTAGKPVLLVGEATGFALKGGCINFVLEDKKVRFEINVEAVKRAEVEVSSQLLKLARIVSEERR